MAKSMIFFSMHYPFHFTDIYLDEEINYLANNFDKVIIISSNTHSTAQRPVPKNATLHRFNAFAPSSKYKIILNVFNPFFWKEISLLKKKYQYKINLTLIKELLLNLDRINKIQTYLSKIWNEYELDQHEVLIYNYWFLESASACAFFKKTTNKKFKLISRAHSQEIYFFRNYYGYQPYKYLTFNICDHLYFISENGLNYFSTAHKLSTIEQNKLSINRIGVDCNNQFIPSREDNKLKIISIAWLHKLKRIELIVDAIAQINEVEIEWIHLGSSIDKPYTNMLMQHIEKKLNTKKNISYKFFGETDKEKLKEVFQQKQFDLIINVSETEGIPVSMMEAASFSVPLFGTNVGGVAEIIDDQKNGFLLDSNPTSNDIASIILNYHAKSVSQKNEFRKNAYDTWNNKYNVLKNRVELYENILKLN